MRIINGRRSPGRCRVLAVCKVKLPFSTKFYLPSRMASPIYLCGKCGSEVGDEQDGVQCESECQSWFHATCANIDHDEYERLSTSDVFWECQTCRGSLPALNSVDAVDVFHFDFQQNLPTPKLPVGEQFYLRLLWTYLFGIFCASTRQTAAYMWHEMLAKRGANDVISCLAHFIFRNPLGRTGAKWSVWWADNCSGQNKNNFLMWFFQELIRRKVYSRIDYKFLVVGHTYGPTDRSFGVIERYTSRIDTVYTPQQWYEHVCTAASNVHVMEMKQEAFRDYRSYLRNRYTERSKDSSDQPLDFSNIQWFNFGKGEKMVDGKLTIFEHPTEVWVRHGYNPSESPRCVSFFKKKGVQASEEMPPPLYPYYPIPIKEAKCADLRKLVSRYVPERHQEFYQEMVAEEGDCCDDIM